MSYQGPDDREPERPRSEPEIIPPGRDHRRSSEEFSSVWISVDETGRVHMKRPGAFTVILTLLVIGLIAAVVVVALLGLVLIWIPVVIVLVAAAMLSGTIRYYWQRLRGR